MSLDSRIKEQENVISLKRSELEAEKKEIGLLKEDATKITIEGVTYDLNNFETPVASLIDLYISLKFTYKSRKEAAETLGISKEVYDFEKEDVFAKHSFEVWEHNIRVAIKSKSLKVKEARLIEIENKLASLKSEEAKKADELSKAIKSLENL